MNSAINRLQKRTTKEQDKVTNTILQNQEQEQGGMKTSECHKMSERLTEINHRIDF